MLFWYSRAPVAVDLYFFPLKKKTKNNNNDTDTIKNY